MYKVLSSKAEERFRRIARVRLRENDLLSHNFDKHVNVTPYFFQINAQGETEDKLEGNWIALIATEVTVGPNHLIFKDVRLAKRQEMQRGEFVDMYYKLFLETLKEYGHKLNRSAIYVYTSEEQLLENMLDDGFKVIIAPGHEKSKYKAHLRLR